MQSPELYLLTFADPPVHCRRCGKLISGVAEWLASPCPVEERTPTTAAARTSPTPNPLRRQT